MEELVVRWTIRVAVLIYFVRLYIDLSRVPPRVTSWVRIFWTVGCLINLLHVMLAMYFYHGMSHEHAVEDTAAKTFAVTGFRWGGGVYINYLFSAYWCVDTILWWRNGLDWPRKRWVYTIVLHAVFGFIIINATAVFGPRFWVVLTPVLYIVAGLFGWRMKRQKRPCS